MAKLKTTIKNGITIISTGDSTGGKKNKHGYPGINFDKKLKKFRAEINHKRKKYHLGYAMTIEEAIILRKEAETHMKQGNFIDWYTYERKAGKNGKKD